MRITIEDITPTYKSLVLPSAVNVGESTIDSISFPDYWPVRFTGATLPGGVVAGNTYYTKDGKYYTSKTNAFTNTSPVIFTTQGSGFENTIEVIVSSGKGWDLINMSATVALKNGMGKFQPSQKK